MDGIESSIDVLVGPDSSFSSVGGGGRVPVTLSPVCADNNSTNINNVRMVDLNINRAIISSLSTHTGRARESPINNTPSGGYPSYG